jgi:hypothetical protein
LISSTKEDYSNNPSAMAVANVGLDKFYREENTGDYSRYDSDHLTNSEDGFSFKTSLAQLQPVFVEYDHKNVESPGLIQPVTDVINPQSHKNKISFYAGVGISPDFSTVGLGNFIAPGFRWNFMGEIGFSRRFFINTGIIYVKNKYEAYGEDYHAPVQYWRNGIVANSAYGECIMLDIPLNLRYSIVLKDRHQIFISGGASTYFLLKEDYYFHYDQDDPALPTYWGTNNVSIYPFGIVNLSLGYQYQLGRKGSIQVEPFIKLPTGGIGWGNVDLHTIGVYFMYKYRIGR